MSRELLQQALDALLHSDSPSQKRADAIAALREASAAPHPEPDIEALRKVAHELRYYNPQADEYKGKHVHKYWSEAITAAIAAPPAAPAPAVPPGMALVPINELSRLRKHAGFNVVELAYEQRESPGPFVGLAGTTNVMFAEQAHGIGGGGK